MTYRARFALAALAAVTTLSTPVPAAQTAGQTQTAPRRQRIYVPSQQRPGRGANTGQPSGGKTSDGPPRTNGDGAPTPKPEGGGDQAHPPQRPTRRPPFGGVVITIGGGDGPQEPRPDKDKKDGNKKDDRPGGDPAADAPRPLKYDGRAYRSLADSLLERGRVDAALRMLALLKEQEYYQYTGSFGDRIAELPSPPDYRALAVRVVAKKKDTSAAAAGDASSGSWEDRLEAAADQTLALEQEAASLRAIPDASRTPEQRVRLAAVERDLDRASADLDALLDALSRDLGATDPRVKNLRAAERLADELGQLPPGTVALYTLTARERFWTIVVSPLGRNAYQTPIRSGELDRKVLAFRKVLCNPKQDPAPLARELYDVVLGRASADPAMITARTLLWSFDGVLRYVPAAALNDGQQYLVERYRNVVFNRASVDTLLDAPSGRLEGVGLGVARQIAPYRALPAVADELGGIFAAGGTGVVPGRVLLDASFTEPALEQALGGDNPVVHIATHFRLSPTDADGSLLLLGDGTLVNVGQIRRIKGGFRGVDLLTLSACDTAASGPTSDGREVECFGTIAQERGAKSVIASLWPVSDRSTSLLMQTFYRMRAASPSTPKAELFRQAQRALLEGTATVPAASSPSRDLVQDEPEAVPGQPAYTPDPKAPFAHPYYWAPFLMIGNFR